MTRLTTIRFLLIALVSAAWVLPLSRAVRLLSYALSVDDGSIDTANDTSFGSSLVVSYCFSFAVALAIALGLLRKSGQRRRGFLVSCFGVRSQRATESLWSYESVESYRSIRYSRRFQIEPGYGW